jgi:hypothetical protein
MRTYETQVIDLEKKYNERLKQAIAKFDRVAMPKDGLYVPPFKVQDAAADLILKLEDLTNRGWKAGYRLGAKACQKDLEKQGVPLKIVIEPEDPPADMFQAKQRTISVIENAVLAFGQGIGGQDESNKVRSSAVSCLSSHINGAWTFSYIELLKELEKWSSESLAQLHKE